MIAPTFFFIGSLVILSVMELRKWLEMFLEAGRDSDPEPEKPEPMSDSVKHMNMVFRECSSLKSVTLPNGLTKIGGGLFSECTALESITFPESVKAIEEEAFMRCGFKTITLPEGLTAIEGSTFKDCTSLASINIPNSVTSIGKFAFENCTALKTIYFSGTLADWNNLDKGEHWDRMVSGCTVKCTDGDITIN